MKPLPARKLLTLAALPLALLVVVTTIAARGESETDRTLRDLKVFAETVQLVERFYVEEVEFPQLERGAFQGLAESLDPWSSYYDPVAMQRLLARNRAGDVGLLLLKPAQQYVLVAAVVPGSPAAAAGVEPRQYIETIDGLATKDLTLLEASHMLQGPPGTTVELGFFREGDEEGRQVQLARSDPGALRVVAERLSPETALLRVTDVRAGAADRVRAEVARLREDGVQALVLDLRVNLGGDPAEARRVADLFVPAGPLFERRGRDGVRRFAAEEPAAWEGPVVVLTSRATIGEGELLVAALKEAGGVPAIGEPTFGKSAAQDLVLLSDGAGIFLTVAEYRRADGSVFEDEGIQPDERVARHAPAGEEPEPDPAAAGDGGEPHDAQVQRALEILAGSPVAKAA